MGLARVSLEVSVMSAGEGLMRPSGVSKLINVAVNRRAPNSVHRPLHPGLLECPSNMAAGHTPPIPSDLSQTAAKQPSGPLQPCLGKHIISAILFAITRKALNILWMTVMRTLI